MIENNECFVIDNDQKAEWAILKIKEEREEADRYIETCKAMMYDYQEKIKNMVETKLNKTAGLESMLRQYFETVKTKETKTQKTYKLPAGTLKLKYQQPEFKRDDPTLIKWLKNNELSELVKVEEKADWATLKKTVEVAGSCVILEDGVIVEGVAVIEREPVFEIDIS